VQDAGRGLPAPAVAEGATPYGQQLHGPGRQQQGGAGSAGLPVLAAGGRCAAAGVSADEQAGGGRGELWRAKGPNTSTKQLHGPGRQQQGVAGSAGLPVLTAGGCCAAAGVSVEVQEVHGGQLRQQQAGSDLSLQKLQAAGRQQRVRDGLVWSADTHSMRARTHAPQGD
jgi:hypothetical protein